MDRFVKNGKCFVLNVFTTDVMADLMKAVMDILEESSFYFFNLCPYNLSLRGRIMWMVQGNLTSYCLTKQLFVFVRCDKQK